MNRNVVENERDSSLDESPRALVGMIEADVIAAAGLVALGADGALDRETLTRKLIDMHGTIAMLRDALTAEGSR